MEVPGVGKQREWGPDPQGLLWQRWEEVDRIYRAGARHNVPTHRRSRQLAEETEARGLPKVPQQSWDSPLRPPRPSYFAVSDTRSRLFKPRSRRPPRFPLLGLSGLGWRSSVLPGGCDLPMSRQTSALSFLATPAARTGAGGWQHTGLTLSLRA